MEDQFIHSFLEDPTPAVFSRLSMTRLFYQENRISQNAQLIFLDIPARRWLDKAIRFLTDPRLEKLIKRQQVTVGAIKPHVEESKLLMRKDSDAEQYLLSLIRPPLERVFQIALAPSTQDIERFYPLEVQERRKAILEGGKPAWGQYTDYLNRGPLTYVLLYSEEGAIKEWRRQIGKTDPSLASSDSLRGKFAHSTRQNLLHGSSEDAPREAQDEVNWLVTMLLAIKNSLDTHVSLAKKIQEKAAVSYPEQRLLGVVQAVDSTTMYQLLLCNTHHDLFFHPSLSV